MRRWAMGQKVAAPGVHGRGPDMVPGGSWLLFDVAVFGNFLHG